MDISEDGEGEENVTSLSDNSSNGFILYPNRNDFSPLIIFVVILQLYVSFVMPSWHTRWIATWRLYAIPTFLYHKITYLIIYWVWCSAYDSSVVHFCAQFIHCNVSTLCKQHFYTIWGSWIMCSIFFKFYLILFFAF